MGRISVRLALGLAAILVSLSAALALPQAQMAKGVVFHDRNGNGMRDAGEEGLRGVAVSNQREVVVTDAAGEWRLPYDDDTAFFVIKPRNWAAPLDHDNKPLFYYIYKPNGSPKSRYAGVQPTGPLPESIDFPLTPRPEPTRFKAVFLGDTQPYSIQEVDYVGHDVVEELIGTDAAFGVVLGDIVGDNLSLFEPLCGVIGRAGIPIYYTIGNHDTNYDSMTDELSDETFECVFGPDYYSFDYGPVHFAVMDDIYWSRKSEADSGGYVGRFGEAQLEFLRNDLALVPKETLVVLTMHIPIVGVEDREEAYRIIEQRPHTLSFSAHTHNQQHVFIGKDAGWRGATPHHHLINATSCGSWWRGAPDELGIPHATMSDGAPNGYSIVTFDGSDYSIEFKAARRPANCQMHIFAPDEVAAADAANTDVFVNVYAGSEKSVVEMRFDDGTWRRLEQVRRPDPFYVALKESEKAERPPNGKTLPGPSGSSHLWTGKLPPTPAKGAHTIQIRTTDMFGHTYDATRVIRVK
jgi:hypothetical protein